MHCRKLNRNGIALPIVFVFLVISQLVYVGLLRINQLNMQHHRLFQQHYVAAIQLLIARSWLVPSSQTLNQQWESNIQKILSEQFAYRIGDIPFTWLTDESFQTGVLQLNESELLVFEQIIEVLEGKCEVPVFDTSDAIRQNLEEAGYRLVEALQSEDKGDWQASVPQDMYFQFNTGEVHYQSPHLLSETFHSDTRILTQLPHWQCKYLVKCRAFFYREE